MAEKQTVVLKKDGFNSIALLENEVRKNCKFSNILKSLSIISELYKICSDFSSDAFVI